MKISTEQPDFRSKSINFEEIRVRNEISSAKENINRQLTQSVISRIHADKRVIDALTTSHVAQSLIHKAMEVAARLNRAAQQSLIEAGVGFEEIGRAAKSSSELESLGRILDTLNPEGNVKITEKIPYVSPELEKLKNFADAAASSGSIDIRELEQIYSSLAGKNDSISEFIGKLGIPAGDRNDFSREQATEISNSILTAPGTALAAQANLSNEQVSQKI